MNNVVMESIEFMGMPQAGKSTQLEFVENDLKHRKNAKVRSIYESARICPFDKQERFQYNAWSFHNITNKIMEARLYGFDYLLIDRGVYDHIAFTEALYRDGQITKEQYEAQTRYLKEFGFLEDMILIFMVAPRESMRRENKHFESAGRVMNMSFLSKLYEAYQTTIPTITQQYFVIDGTKTIEDNIKEVSSILK
jgi:thymidylate kinase